MLAILLFPFTLMISVFGWVFGVIGSVFGWLFGVIGGFFGMIFSLAGGVLGLLIRLLVLVGIFAIGSVILKSLFGKKTKEDDAYVQASKEPFKSFYDR